jgi:Tfp pilus assembly protein PilF
MMAILLRVYTNKLPDTSYAAPLMDSPGRVLSIPPIIQVDPEAEVKKQKKLDAELVQLNAQLKANPLDPVAYGDRGNIHAARKEWTLAENDYRSALKINGKLAKASFNYAEMEFAQKKYDSARPGFLALKSDENLGDLAAYKVFLCDLYGGHEAAADKELDVFNQAGTEASYYFANIAWFLYHKKTDEARDWLKSATHIYEQYKIDLYTATLTELGYLPLPPQE